MMLGLILNSEGEERSRYLHFIQKTLDNIDSGIASQKVDADKMKIFRTMVSIEPDFGMTELYQAFE